MKMYMKVKKLQKRIRTEFPEIWDQDDFDARLKALEDWNRIRELEALNLERKAEIFKYAVYSSLFLAVITGTLMLVAMIFLSNGNEGFYSAMVVFEILMLTMLALHIVLVLWRWLWFKTLDKLALIVPVEYE